MSFFNSLIVGAVCISVVFLVLAALFALIQTLSRILASVSGKGASDKKPHAANAANSENAARTSVLLNNAVRGAEEQTAAAHDPQMSLSAETSSLKLDNVDERTAAMVMAVVSHETKIPLDELVFRSISLVK
jgi:Na+-transporting methylmalonyl-CoA/oxaloacetate decarboxylase gamma subunit